jgi:hypothetical protein
MSGTLGVIFSRGDGRGKKTFSPLAGAQRSLLPAVGLLHGHRARKTFTRFMHGVLLPNRT